MRVYLDTNAIQEAARWFPSAADLEHALGAAGYTLSLGFHVVYELTRGYVAGRTELQPCIAVLAEMDGIHHIPQPSELIRNEVFQLLYGGKALNIVPVDVAGAIKSGLYFLSRGHTDEAARFIGRREKRFRILHPRIAQANRDMFRAYVRENPTIRPALETWEGFRRAARPLWARMVLKATGPLPRGMAEGFFHRPEDFPVINTWLNSQLHLMYLSWHENDLPSKSRVDDYRNVIESNAAELFVTDDGKLLKRFSAINPFRRVLPWDDFLAGMSVGAAPKGIIQLPPHPFKG